MGSSVTKELETLMKSLMVEASRKGTEAKPAMVLKERLSILDRALKLEAIKAKVKEDEFGKDFDRDPPEGQDE